MQAKTFGKVAGELFGDRYQIEKQLGKRAGRYTLLARDLLTQEQVVIKRLSFGEDFLWDDLKLFEREAATLKTLFHPAIPRYLDHFELDLSSGKGFALVQTYIAAPSLAEHIQAGRSFNETEVIELATSLLEILHYLHERAPAVIHRDIKPSNILLENRTGNSVGKVYLVDFGSVQTLAARMGGTITVVGTYGYMPPEQFGDRAIPASDLYGLGATLIYLLTGQQPADLPLVDQKIQFESFTQLSPSFTHWLKQMIEPDLSRRFSSAQEAIKALQARTEAIELRIEQPLHSKIVFRKEENLLEIVLPPVGRTPGGLAGILFMVPFAIAWNSFILTWTGMALMAPFPINLAFSLFSLPFWAAGFSMVAGIIFSLFGHTRLRVDEQRISQHYELFGFKKAIVPASHRQDISKLELTKRSYTKDSDGDRVEIKPQLLLWAGTRKYGFYGLAAITPTELEWLAQELSTMLDLPIL
jgi:serine/threonine protein kinase